MIIRDERPADIAAIRRITDAAFEDVPHFARPKP
jgi:predicted N-acetyltransferase YhbS